VTYSAGSGGSFPNFFLDGIVFLNAFL